MWGRRGDSEKRLGTREQNLNKMQDQRLGKINCAFAIDMIANRFGIFRGNEARRVGSRIGGLRLCVLVLFWGGRSGLARRVVGV